MKEVCLFSAAALVFLGSASPPGALRYDAAVLVADLPATRVAAPSGYQPPLVRASITPASDPIVEVRLEYADPSALEASSSEVIRWDQLSEPVVVRPRPAPRESWSGGGGNAGGPVRVVISLPQQRAFVYRGAALLWTSPVSTGKRGHSTPTGTFPILQKKVKHNSNLYNNAPMPFMQRLTHSGVAIHAGNLPGFRASHGCIRMPWSKAKKLFGITSHGTPVTITNQRVNDTA